MKILITGGSGFIGTNIIEELIKNSEDILNLDICKPKIFEHLPYWNKVNVMDFDQFAAAVNKFKPDTIIHLAARTDLIKSADLSDYSVNILGVKNLLKIIQNQHVKNVIHFSTMLVHSRQSLLSGGAPNPDTDYGRSKLFGEKLITNSSAQHRSQVTLLRPTSLWGPWFGTPYDQFFKFARKRILFFPRRPLAKKSFGYISNCVEQTLKFVYSEPHVGLKGPFYLADTNPISISSFTNRIRQIEGLREPIYCPSALFYIASFVGDCLNWFGVKFPLNSYRWANLIQDRYVNSQDIVRINQDRVVGFDDAIKTTLKWMKN